MYKLLVIFAMVLLTGCGSSDKNSENKMLEMIANISAILFYSGITTMFIEFVFDKWIGITKINKQWKTIIFVVSIFLYGYIGFFAGNTPLLGIK